MASDYKKIDIFVTNSVLEPLLSDGVLDSLYNGVVCITLKVKEEAKGHDSNALVLCGEFSESLCKRLQLSGFWVVDVEIGGDVSLLEVWYGMVVFIIGRVLLIEFMVARSDDVYLLVFENVRGIMSFGVGGVVKTVAFYSVACVYEKKVATVVVGSLAEVMSKRDVVTPVGGILGSVSTCQVGDFDEEYDRLTPAGGRHAIHVCLSWPRSLIDPKEAFAKELLLVQGPKVGQLVRPAVELQKARGCRISLLSLVDEISFIVVADQQATGHSGTAKTSCARVKQPWSLDISYISSEPNLETLSILVPDTTLQFTPTTQCLHDHLRRRGVTLALAVPTPELRARLRAHLAVQSLPDPHQVLNAAAHLAHAVLPTRVAAVVPIAPAAHLEAAIVVPALRCLEAQK
jgi:hypothetical protein